MKTIPLLVLVCGVCAAASAQDFPRAEISNRQVRATVYLPDAERGYYRATRFDWSGVIAKLEYAGHSYFGQWFEQYDPKLHDAIMGPVEEFLSGTTLPGYDDAKPGGTFIRVGVGALRKPEEPQFRRFNTYDIVDGGQWQVRRRPDSIEFVHRLTDKFSGYAYEYTKTVRLIPGKPRLALEHTLRNTGVKAINTDVYDHNFFVIDGQPTGPDFLIRFPFRLEAARDLKGMAQLRENEIIYLRELGSADRVQTELKGFGSSTSDYDIHVENGKTGAGVRITANRPLSKVVFWSARSVLSPEPYITMTVEPGRDFTWRILYDFYTLPGK